MRIVSVDPAPSKASTVYDGKWSQLKAIDLNGYISGISSSGNCLVCWDAPLTGPWDPLHPGSAGHDYSQRPIERFFSRKINGFKVPKGISVMPYAGCPHWAISRAILGLPQVGPWDAATSTLPLVPMFEGTAPNDSRAYVVEIHPAVALWLWCKEENITSWAYKKDPAVFSVCCDAFVSATSAIGGQRPQTDDELDAMIGYTLAERWLADDGSVVLLGNQHSGSFLVPNVSDIQERFRTFMAKEPS